MEMIHFQETRNGIREYFLLAAIATATTLVYLPGLSGGFLFDDYSNLALLGFYGAIDNWQAFWLYLLSGFSGPTGRPISHLSFLIDADNWPADPRSFKQTNLAIHILSGLALFGLTQALAIGIGKTPNKAKQIALLSASLWLLHPFWVSTTLYVVQRMAQLSTFFVLTGLWIYVATRLRHPPILNTGNLLGLGVSIIIFGLAAALSKENGALLPLFVLAIEATVLRVYAKKTHRTASRPFQIYRFLLLSIPIAFIVYYMAKGLPSLYSGDPGQREFTPGERLLTQGRILWDYAFNLIFPRPYTGGLFNDNIKISTGLFTPWNTALAWAALVGIFIWALRNRIHRPASSLAILFFLVGHTLESSFLQLELYFEHRNYLPAALIGFPIAIWIIDNHYLNSTTKRIISVLAVTLLASMTLIRSDLWGNPFQQAIKWAELNPNSPRALHYLESFWFQTGNLSESERLNLKAIEQDPDGIPWLMRRVVLDCALGTPASESTRRVIDALNKKPIPTRSNAYQTGQLLDFLLTNECKPVSDPEFILRIANKLITVDMARQEPAMLPLLLQRRALAHLKLHNNQDAFKDILLSLTTSNNPGIQLQGAAMLATHGAYEEALLILDHDLPLRSTSPRKSFSIDKLREIYTEKSGYYMHEKADLRRRIMHDFLNNAG